MFNPVNSGQPLAPAANNHPTGDAPALSDAQLAAMPAPAHVASLLWQYASPQERRALLAQGESPSTGAAPQGEAKTTSRLPSQQTSKYAIDGPTTGAQTPHYTAEAIASLSPMELQARNTAMLAALKPYFDSGDYIAFWQTAAQYGEPLAPLALAFHGSLYGDTLSTRLAVSKLGLAKTGGDQRLTPNQLAELKKDVGVGVMKAHYKALKVDIEDNEGEIAGVLSVRQIQNYHEKYFNYKGLSAGAYGGHGVPDIFERWVYCGACDPRP